MGPFLNGFTDELVKLGALTQQNRDASPYEAGSPAQKVMNKIHNSREAKGPEGLTGPPILTAAHTKKLSPGPDTTPNYMVSGYASRG